MTEAGHDVLDIHRDQGLIGRVCEGGLELEVFAQEATAQGARVFFGRCRDGEGVPAFCAAAGAQRVTTGFFRPEYFYSYGFKIERKYAGLVKELHQ